MITYGQKSHTVNDTRSVLDGFGKNAFVVIDKIGLVGGRWQGYYGCPSTLCTPDQPAERTQAPDQLDRLLSAVLAVQQTRGSKNLPKRDEPRRPKRTKEVDAPPLAQGKLNAVRAAFKAGVTPSRIARQFGVSLSDVRKALANDGKKWVVVMNTATAPCSRCHVNTTHNVLYSIKKKDDEYDDIYEVLQCAGCGTI
jgi:hypothetical protein